MAKHRAPFPDHWADEKRVRQWMWNELNAAPEEYFDSAGEPQYAQLAEQAAWALDPDDTWLDDPDHGIWDLAVDVLDAFTASAEEEGVFYPKGVRQAESAGTVAVIEVREGPDSYSATLTDLDGRPYTNEYEGIIDRKAWGKSGPDAVRKLVDQWDRAGFLD